MRAASHLVLTIGFLAIILAPAVVQWGADWRRHEFPQSLEVLTQLPRSSQLHRYEQRLEDESLTVRTLRPWMQYAQFALLHNPGAKALRGRSGWYFYRPGVEYVTQRAAPEESAGDPLRAICDFRDQLRARGIHLIVVPAPNKESIYPDQLTRRAEGKTGVMARATQSLLTQLQAANVDVVNLFEVFGAARQGAHESGGGALYLHQDSHWSPRGVSLAAQAVADRIRQHIGTTQREVMYQTRPVELRRLGDVLEMLRVPLIERSIEPESILCQQVVRCDQQQLYCDQVGAEVLVLGDSFLRIYQLDEPGAAGFIAHLALQLQQPVSSIVNDGGASTLVRQQLYRRSDLLANAKVVVWEFVERDIRFGMEGWQIVPLPR